MSGASRGGLPPCQASAWRPPAGDHLSARCCCHVFTARCPIDCLEVVLSTATFHALVRAEWAPFDPPATVGQVLELVRAGQLSQVVGMGPRRVSEIQAGLVLAGLILSADMPPAGRPRTPGSGPGPRDRGDGPPAR